MSKKPLILPGREGFSPGFQRRIESAMHKKAEAFQGLPPEIATQFMNGLMLAVSQGQLFNMNIAFGTPDAPIIVKVLMFQEKNQGIKQPVAPLPVEDAEKPAPPEEVEIEKEKECDTTPV